MQVAEHRRDRLIEVELDAPVPHLDQGLLEGAAAEQRRLRAQTLEVPADRNRLGDHRAVIEHQHGHALQRIERGEFRGLVLERPEVDLLDRNRQSLFGKEDAHAARIGCAAAVVELHSKSP
jgi:hypothetical protein